MKFVVEVELKHVSGPVLDEETMVDAFCGTVGRQNGASSPLRVVTYADDGENEVVYEVELVDLPS